MGLASAVRLADNHARRRGNQHSEGELTQRKIPVMGDKSPKSAQKKASQKQAKANDSSSKKQALITSQQATKAKLAANKKK
ncbi:MAG TPA: hypothetical protein VIO38_03455 [Rariglobus sp.]|jgi:hypothetical protein